MKQCLFILGMHRSGTSALSGALSLLDFDYGSKLLKADEHNPKGYFENTEVYNLNKAILKECNSHWDDYTFKISDISSLQFNNYVSKAKKIINNEFKESDKFSIKDPRNCFLFPVWEAACKELRVEMKVIIPYRNPLEVAASLNKRDGFSKEKSMLLWCYYFISAEYLSRRYKRFFILFDDYILNPQTLISKVEKLVGITCSKRQLKNVQEFLNQKIKHNNIPLEKLSNNFPFVVQKLFDLVKSKDFENQELFEKLRTKFNLLSSLFNSKQITQIKEEKLFLGNSVEKYAFLRRINTTNVQVYFRSNKESFSEELSISKTVVLDNTPKTTSFQIPASINFIEELRFDIGNIVGLLNINNLEIKNYKGVSLFIWDKCSLKSKGNSLFLINRNHWKNRIVQLSSSSDPQFVIACNKTVREESLSGLIVEIVLSEISIEDQINLTNSRFAHFDIDIKEIESDKNSLRLLGGEVEQLKGIVKELELDSVELIDKFIYENDKVEQLMANEKCLVLAAKKRDDEIRELFKLIKGFEKLTKTHDSILKDYEACKDQLRFKSIDFERAVGEKKLLEKQAVQNEKKLNEAFNAVENHVIEKTKLENNLINARLKIINKENDNSQAKIKYQNQIRILRDEKNEKISLLSNSQQTVQDLQQRIDALNKLVSKEIFSRKFFENKLMDITQDFILFKANKSSNILKLIRLIMRHLNKK